MRPDAPGNESGSGPRAGQRAGTSSGPRVQAGSSNRSGRWVSTRSVRPSVAAGRSRQECPRRRLVEVLGGLVEDEDPDVGQESPGQCETLPLATGQAGAVLPHRRLEAVRQAPDPVQQPGPLQGLLQLWHAGARAREPEVVGDRGVEDVRVLLAQADRAADVVARDRADVLRLRVPDQLQ